MSVLGQDRRMAGFGDDVSARWSHIQSSLFPWLREELDPVTTSLGQLIAVLAMIGVAAYVPGPPRHGRGRKPEDRRALARALSPNGVGLADHSGGDRAIGHR